MTSAIDKDEFNFEDSRYFPSISPNTPPHIQANWMESHIINNSLANRIAFVSSIANHSTYVMDTCIRVKISSDIFRQDKVKHWEEKHGTAKSRAWAEGGIAVISAIGAFALHANPYFMGVVLGVASVASGILCFLNVKRTQEASRQIEGWTASPPLEKIAKERAKAYREGFPYVYNNDLKLEGSSNYQVILPHEVCFLFERHFDRFSSKLLPQNPPTEQGRKEWLDDFTHCNPLDGKVLRYAYGVVPNPSARVSYDYDVLHQQLTDLRGAFNKLRRERQEETNKIVRGINNNRDLALAPFLAMLVYWEHQAKADRDAKLAQTKDTQEIEKIKNEYSSTVEKYHLYHIAAIIPVNLVFDKQVSDAKTDLKNILKEITKNEASSHAPYFNYAWSLLNYAKQVKETPTYVYQPQPLSPAQIFHIPAISAPPVININFVQQAQEQKPQGMDDSRYADYLKFVSWRQQQPQQAG